MKIKIFQTEEYLTLPSPLRTALSDFYFRTKSCAYLVCEEDGEIVGFLQYEEKGGGCEICLLRAAGDDAAVKYALVKALCERSSVKWRMVTKVLIGSGDFDPSLPAIAEELGFRPGSLVHLFAVNREKLNNEAMKTLLDRLRGMRRRICAAGYTVFPFSQITEEDKDYICNDPEGEFASFLQSGSYINGLGGAFDGDASCVAFMDGKPVAYTVIRRPGKRGCILENISVAKSYRRSGVLAAVLSFSIEALVYGDYDSATFAVHESNTDSYPIIRKWVTPVLTSEKVQCNYFYKP